MQGKLNAWKYVLSIPPHLNFARPGQTQNSKQKSKNSKIFNLSSMMMNNAKPKVKSQMKFSEIIALHEQQIPTSQSLKT